MASVITFDGPIDITHYINPSLFWFKKNNGGKDFRRLEDKLQSYAINYSKLPHDKNYKIGEKVAVYSEVLKKWIRAVVDVQLDDEKTLILWAIDYGIPIKSEIEYIIPITDSDLASKCLCMIYKGGVYGVIPAKEVLFNKTLIITLFFPKCVLCLKSI